MRPTPPQVVARLHRLVAHGLSIRQAARECGLNRKTAEQRLKAGSVVTVTESGRIRPTSS